MHPITDMIYISQPTPVGPPFGSYQIYVGVVGVGDWEVLSREMERLSELGVCAKKWDKDAILRGLMALKLCNLFFLN